MADREGMDPLSSPSSVQALPLLRQVHPSPLRLSSGRLGQFAGLRGHLLIFDKHVMLGFVGSFRCRCHLAGGRHSSVRFRDRRRRVRKGSGRSEDYGRYQQEGFS